MLSRAVRAPRAARLSSRGAAAATTRPCVRARVSTETTAAASQNGTSPAGAAATQADDAAAAAPPAVDFTPNTQAASGYVEFDTAGQPNMYPVVTAAYEAGSNQDTLETGSANLVVGAGAAAIAAGVLALGLIALVQQGSGGGAADTSALEQLKSLSEYAAAFAAEAL